jgi:multidrug efflux pump
MIAGGLSMLSLPISQYPQIAPPTITVQSSYPGASASVIENSVTQIIEQNMTGLDGLIYMSSTSSSDGSSQLTLTFETGVDDDIAQVQVQNKLQAAMPLLPSIVQQQGVTVNKSNDSFLLILAFYSEDGSMSDTDIGDYVVSNLREPIGRIEGVGSVQVFSSQYAMRVWLNPKLLEAYNLSVSEVIAAINAQNQQVSIGALGGAPAVKGQEINFPINTKGRLQTPEEFRDIIVSSKSDGSYVTLGDIAEVSLGKENYTFSSRYNGKVATGMAVSLATGANALETARRVEKFMETQQQFLPSGMKVSKSFDTTPFVRVAIEGVIHTLVEAIVLVFFVMFLFLQNWRATLIPTIAIPVVLLGTFGVLAVFGFSINMLTMFAMVLAIGLLVDDAIVVVENVERLMSEEGLTPKEAARKSMDQITGALIGIGVVLSAVFVPMAFFGGAPGVIYRQFSITIVSSMALSVLVAIVFTPALCATMLKQIEKGHHIRERGFFGWFNRKFDQGNTNYQRIVDRITSKRVRGMLAYLVVVVIMAFAFLRLPTGFLPNEDQGSFYAMIMGPTGSTEEHTAKVVEKMENYLFTQEKDVIRNAFLVQGFSFAGTSQSGGMAFVDLTDWSQRKDPQKSVTSIVQRAGGAFASIKEAMVFAFAPPPIQELGNSSGFDFYLKDNAGQGHLALMNARNQLLGMAAQSPLLSNVRPNGLEDSPQLLVNVDNKKAVAQDLSISEINTTLGVAWGGRYIDDFIDNGRVKKVYMQSAAPFRMQAENFLDWSVKNNSGSMVPFSSFAETAWTYGSPRLERYNGVPALNIQGQGAPGVSSGEAMDEIERLVKQLPEGFGIEWTTTSYQERQAGNQTFQLYLLSLVIVFLALAALYESWSIPTAVLMAAPLGVLGAVLAAMLLGMERDIYFQVAMLTTVGLTSKNAILIVEFATINLKNGMRLREATLTAVKDRLRPILMTSLAFGLGVVPLATADGAGSGAQNAIGSGVLGGMIVGTSLGLFFVPLFFFFIERLFIRKKPQGVHE